MDLSDITRLISSLRAQTAQNSITPDGLGSILQRIVNAISSIGNIDVEDEQALLTRLSAAEGNAETALTAAQGAQAAAANNVIDSFGMVQDDDKVTVTIKQHGHSAISFDVPAASSLLAGLLSATDKSHLDTAFAKRISALAAFSGDSVVTLKITFADSTEKTVTLTGASGGLGGSAGLMTKEQAEQLAALVSADGTAALKDASNHIKQELATPIILRNVTDTVFDDLAVGDIYYDTGHLFFHAEDSTINNDMGAPSKKVVYYCLADQMFYRWTGSRFVAAIHIESADIDIDVPTKVSDLDNDLGFLKSQDVKDASNHVKQSLATPVVLRNVTATVFDDLSEGDIYFDSGHLFVNLTAGDEDLGAPSKKLIYFCLADSKFYRWGGSSFTAINNSSEIVALMGVSTNQDGTIIFTKSNGDTYTVNLNHTHENMCKLVVCEESELPSTLQTDTIYAQVDDSDTPTEIEKLYIAGLEFVGGGGDDDTPKLMSPVGTDIDFNGSSTKTITVKGKNLTGALSLAVTGNFTVTSGGSSVSSISANDANTGIQLTLTKSSGFTVGTLVISSATSEFNAKTFNAIDSQSYQSITAVKFTRQQCVLTDIYPGPQTRLEIDMKLDGDYMDCSSGTGRTYSFLGCPDEGSSTPKKVFRANTGVLTDFTNAAQTRSIFAWVEDSYVATSYEIKVADANIKNRGTLIFDMVNHTASFNGASVAVPTKTITMQEPMYFGGGSTGIPFGLTDLIVYSIKHYEDNVLTHEYLPKTLAGVAGLYDTKTETFITSETSVDLVAIS